MDTLCYNKSLILLFQQWNFYYPRFMISAQQFLRHDSQCFYRCIFNKTRKEIGLRCSFSGVHFPIEIMSAVFHLQSPMFSNQLTILIGQEQLFTSLGKWDRKLYFLSSPETKTLIFWTTFHFIKKHMCFKKLRHYCDTIPCKYSFFPVWFTFILFASVSCFSSPFRRWNNYPPCQ